MKVHTITTPLNCELVTNVFEAANSSCILIIISATGVKQNFYHRFARYLSENGITVITFDYSGIGQSLKGHIRNTAIGVADWGSDNLQTVIEFAKQTFLGKRLCLLGHSIGGQLIGLAANSVYADRIILIASQSGYWKFWTGFSKYRMWVLWYFFFPVLTKLFGYLPSKSFSKMENLPKQAAIEWSKWCRHKEYLFDFIDQGELYFDKIRCNIYSYSIADDSFAPVTSVAWLTSKYSKAIMEKHHILPYELAVKKIGHFGLFTKKFQNNFWHRVVEYLK
ncbi:MAG: alpha/beta fold hydrolase [Ferruginibacter sp.]|nr:alpha/beta fold hydrolase [Bacteroidota bacterium]MBX2919707.1 alpha/beta fold hydrolase [Ferruginibacter sp.]